MKCCNLVFYFHTWYTVVFQCLRIRQISLFNSSSVLTAQYEEFVKILEALHCSKITSENAELPDERKLSGYFCLDTNCSKRVHSEKEIKILEKGLDYAPMQRKINELGLRGDF